MLSTEKSTTASPIIFNLKQSGKTELYTAVANKGGYLYAYDEGAREQSYKVPTTTIQNADSPPTQQGTHVCPGITGGVEWFGPAFNPQTSQIFLPSVDWCTTYTLGEVRYTPGQLFFGGAYAPDDLKQAKGYVKAYDAATGKEAWTYTSDLPMVAGVTPTAGRVIFTGELNGDFIALDQKTGKKLYSFYTGGPVAGGISTYQVNGRQYVAVASGNQSRTWSPEAAPSPTLLIFALPGKGAGAGGGSSNGG